MANQGHPNNTYNVGQDLNQQPQMMRNEYTNQPSDTHNQGQATNFLQETGTNVKSMAHSAVNIAQGAVAGAANMAQGAAGAVKSTLGMDSPGTATGGGTTINHTGGTTRTTTTGATINHPPTTYPSSTNHPSNPSS